jgi:phosphoribosyl-AMP cyclohydrolase
MKNDREWGSQLDLKYDAMGLVTAIAQDHHSGQILMVAHMNEAAFQATLATGYAHYYSRSRRALWKKGETSGEVQKMVAMLVDCDQDALLLKVEVQGHGTACHNGFASCFYRQIAFDTKPPSLTQIGVPLIDKDKLYS